MGRWGRSRGGGTKPRATVIGFLTPVCEGYANEKADWLISGKVVHLAVLCDSLRCAAYGTFCYGIS